MQPSHWTQPSRIPFRLSMRYRPFWTKKDGTHCTCWHGTVISCITMGFATTFGDFIVTRFVSGILGSAVSTSALAMLADLTEDRKERVRAVARLPMVAFCGKLGPLAADSIRRLSKGRQTDVFARYPELSGQIACASLVFMIGPAETLLLEGVCITVSQYRLRSHTTSEDASDLPRCGLEG